MSLSSLSMYLRMWDPDKQPVHCSNCRNARVRGDPTYPVAWCAAGHSERAVELARLLRPGAKWFGTAATCPDFERMSDDDAGAAAGGKA